MFRNTVVSSYCVLITIRQLKSLKLENKENYFQTNAAGFVRLPYLVEKGQNVSMTSMTITVLTFLKIIVTLYVIVSKQISKSD